MDPVNPQQPTSSSIAMQMESPKKPFFHKKLFFALLIILLLILGVIVVYFLMQGNSPKPTEDHPPTTQSPQSQTVVTPDVSFSSYSFPEKISTIPSTVKLYSLKSHFTKESVDKIAQVFDLASGIEGENSFTYSVTLPQKAAIFNFNKNDGSFTYQSYTPTPSKGTNPQSIAKALLSNIGIDDTMIDCSITYKNAKFPNVTYVECHRMWDRLGLPLVTLPGMYNTPVSKPISQMKVGFVEKEDPKDEAIIEVSTGQNGYVRPKDFNTATFVINRDGSIVSIDSNLRWIDATSTLSQEEIKTSKEAVTELSTDPYYSLVMPSGSGAIDLAKVFPDNKATGELANITDYELVYLERARGEAQNVYEPFYVARGTSTLTNGFNVNLVQAIPAQKEAVITSLAGEDSIQIGSFTPPPTQPPEIPSIPSQPPAERQCKYGASSQTPDNSHLIVNYTLAVPGYGTMQFTTQSGTSHTLYLTSYDTAGSAYTNASEAVAKLFENSFVSTYTSLYKGNPQILPYENMAGYYKAHPSGSTTPIGATPAGIPPRQGIVGPEREQMLKNYEAKVLAYDRGEAVSADGPGFSITNNTPTDGTNSGNSGDFLMFFAIDATAYKNSCVYITGSSPSIFVRGNGNFNITPTYVTYMDPSSSTSAWNVTVSENKIQTDDREAYDFLYYEFDVTKANLNASSLGYSIKTADLQSLVNKLSLQMKLTTIETSQFYNEINNILKRNKRFVNLYFVNQADLDQKLPLSISPQTNLVRIHFLVEESDKKANLKTPPALPTMKDHTILELGASKK